MRAMVIQSNHATVTRGNTNVDTHDACATHPPRFAEELLTMQVRRTFAEVFNY
jgi:hypothetical protein